MALSAFDDKCRSGGAGAADVYVYRHLEPADRSSITQCEPEHGALGIVSPVRQNRGMSEVTVRELRNHGADVLQRVVRGEALTVTRDGEAIAELRPLRRRPVPAATLLARWRRLPAVDPAKLKADIDAATDAAL